MKIKDIPYNVDFYWKGVRYTQVIRPKNLKGRFVVVCRQTFDPCEWIDMPSGRKVKPVVSIDEYERRG